MLIAEKPVEEYLNEINEQKVELEAVGFFIKKAVDLANELIPKGYKVEEISTETIQQDNRNLSKIKIVMQK